MSENKKTVTMSLRILEGEYKCIQKLAAKQRTTASELIRQFIKKGMSIQGYRDDVELIGDHLMERILAYLEPQVERLAALNVKTGIVSASSNYLLAEVMQKISKQDMSEIISSSKKMGVAYMRSRDRKTEEEGD